MTGKRCPQCNAEYELNQRFCSIDGAVLRGPDAGDQLEGSIIAGREILRLLGEGGMGQVYLARSIRTGRLDALKVMRPELAKSSEAVGRFNREAMNGVRIQHQNVAIVYDVGDTEDGVPYLAMEFVDGESLEELLKRETALQPARTAMIVEQIANALQAAHQLGIVHRDLKPGNVMIANNGAADVIKLVDFGISKVVGAAEQQLTSSGVSIGSPAYMSPEQVMGDAVITPQSDVYALALVAYRMLTGRLPFDGDGSEQMMARVLHPPLALAAARPDVEWSDDIERVFAKGLATNVSDRYSTAPEFAGAFRLAAGALSSEQATIKMTPDERAKLRTARRRGAFHGWARRTLIGGGVLAVALGLWAWLGMRPGATHEGGTDSVARSSAAPQTKGPALAAGATKASGRGSPPGGDASKVPSASIRFATPALRVRDAALSPGARSSVDSAIKVLSRGSAVVRADNAPSAAVDMEFTPDAAGRINARTGNAQTASIAAVSDSLLAFLRYSVATRYLSELSKGATQGDLVLEFEQRSPEMRLGESFRFRMRSNRGGYLTILDVGPSGHLTLLIPNAAASDVRQLVPNVETVIPERSRSAITTIPPAGRGQLWAIVTKQPLQLSITLSNDAPSAAQSIVDAVQRNLRSSDSPWSAVSLGYELKPNR